MADAKPRHRLQPLLLRAEAGQLLSPEMFAGRIENMYQTEEGTLRAVQGPAPYENVYTTGGGLTAGDPLETYVTPLHGVFHAVLKGGEQDVLLLHDARGIYEHRGWLRSWYVLASATLGGQMTMFSEDDGLPRFPTQFESTPTGVVIMPKGGKPMFYDGDTIGFLGYDQAPGPPIGLGPRTEFNSNLQAWYESWDGANYSPAVNAEGYAHDAQYGAKGAMDPDFGYCRLGTVVDFAGATMADTFGAGDTARRTAAMQTAGGVLLPGAYRAAYQWIDKWGNVSPLSGQSNPIRFEKQRPRWYDADPVGAGNRWKDGALAMVLKQVCWSGVSKGPQGTVGRIVCRTKDLNNSGTAALFEIPANSAEGTFAFATIPDNTAEAYPDNCPDSWLITEPVDAIPVEGFELGRMWDGRFWAARWRSDPGKLHPSLPGRWGTFARNEELWPDPQGKGLTGLWRSPEGLLVFSDTSAFMVIRADDSGAGYRTQAVSTQVGCVAPSSLATLQDGSVIWLAREGFYLWRDSKIEYASFAIEPLLKRMTRGRMIQACAAVDPRTGEYRCWISVDGSQTNNLCLVYADGEWRRRSDMASCNAVTVSQDHHARMITVGDVAGKGATWTGVWVLDREVFSFIPTPREAVIETAWIGAARALDRKSPLTVYLWLREYHNEALTIETMRDWRETVVDTVDGTSVEQAPYVYPTDDIPPFWNVAVYDATGTTFKRRRPFWRRVAIALPSCEVYKLRIKYTGYWEFIGLTVEENIKDLGGGRTPP